jgi:hypothetical protein
MSPVQHIVCFNLTCPKSLIWGARSTTFKSQTPHIRRLVRNVLKTKTVIVWSSGLWHYIIVCIYMYVLVHPSNTTINKIIHFHSIMSAELLWDEVCHNMLWLSWSHHQVIQSTNLKLIFNTNVKSILLYGCETWKTKILWINCRFL